MALFESAIKVGSVDEERDILSQTVCHGDGFFRRVHVQVRQENGRYYDIVDATYTEVDITRQFFFDVTSCFPCPD